MTDPGSMARYAYVVGNPATLTDAYGYCYQNYSSGRYEGSGCGSRGSRTPSGSFDEPANVGGSNPIDNRTRNAVRHDRPAPFIATYSYLYSHGITEVSGMFTARQIMDIFKSRPGKIFPFPIAGCSEFTAGALCTLQALPTPDGVGQVRASTTDTSVKFTVVSHQYFDGVGSTIEFRTEERNGLTYLVQEANARDSDVFVATGVGAGLANAMWTLQAANLRQELSQDITNGRQVGP